MSTEKFIMFKSSSFEEYLIRPSDILHVKSCGTNSCTVTLRNQATPIVMNGSIEKIQSMILEAQK